MAGVVDVVGVSAGMRVMTAAVFGMAPGLIEFTAVLGALARVRHLAAELPFVARVSCISTHLITYQPGVA
jgi:hypothetical protein